jgi:hypothetical protein
MQKKSIAPARALRDGLGDRFISFLD